ncbi:MAG: hypothetical protein H7645_11990 [Candidatus Heimdallarchaeota archaeon]|nr:hypothetical protein [Candidatus Heimdallarchaeota archaeon]MCK4771044.1 hypothetical protein [Candidatus Heimdallarchaeota archaeon]
MKLALVIREHKNEFSIPLKLHKGEIVQGKEKETKFEGWLWCINKNDVGAWVPKSYLKLSKNPGFYEVLQDYDSTELDVKIGDKVKIINEVSCWFLVMKEENIEGWVPKENVLIDVVN